MRLSFMTSRRPLLAAALAAALTLGFPAAHAQAVVGEGHGTPPTQVRDASLLKPPAGHPVAILELEDLECPACAHDFSTVRAAATQYKIPLLRHDFPLAMHAWSREAAITARYLEDKVSPAAAENFRKDVFANQANIGSKDDLANFTQKWFAAHKQYGNQPFVIDPTGRFAAEVQADSTFGDRLGLNHTPTLFVLSAKGYTELLDVSQLYSVIDNTIAANKVAVSAPVHTNHLKPKTTQN